MLSTCTPSPPMTRYEALLAGGALTLDVPQREAVLALQEVHTRLRTGVEPLRGLYLHSGPGRGKTRLASLLQGDEVRRVHFHDFMLDVHRRLHRVRGDFSALAAALAANTRVLSLDELEVTDVADALVLLRLWSELRRCGVALVATSNRAPEALYKGGLNAGLFQPAFAQAVRESCRVICLDGGRDYRLASSPESHAAIRLCALTREAAARAWLAMLSAGGASSAVSVPVSGTSRRVAVPEACGRACRFTFDALCGGTARTSAADFAALALAFDVFLLDDVPLLGSDEDALRRFVILIDLLYERGKTLLISAREGAWRSPEQLFADSLISSGVGDAVTPHNGLNVLGVGGASGRSTTMMSESVEWSATGRHGARLADLSSGRFTQLAVPRCASRLHEMSRVAWAARCMESLPDGPVMLRALVAALQGDAYAARRPGPEVV